MNRIGLFLSVIAAIALFDGSVGFISQINGRSSINNTGNAISGLNFTVGDQTLDQIDIDLFAANNYAKAQNLSVSGINAGIGEITGSGQDSTADLKTYNNFAESEIEDAVSGIQINTYEDIEYAPFDLTFVAEGNKAVQTGRQGGDAVSGLEFYVNYDSDISDSELISLNTTVRNNFAKSNADDSRAGAEITFGDKVTNTSLFFVDKATNNYARARDDAVAGIERNVLDYIVGDNNISVDVISNAQNNIAKSKTGSAYAGIENDLVYIDGAQLNFSSYAKNNTAKGDYLVISGVRNEFEILQNNQDSLISSSANDNFARSEDTAIAGVQNDVDDSIQNSAIVFDSQSIGNQARTKNEYYGVGAIAGIDNDLDNLENSNVTLLDYSSNNKAKAEEADAISGVYTDIGFAEYSDITIDSNTSNNRAKAKKDGDAISGVYVDIDNLENSNTTIFAQSNNNKAFSVNGSAIAGNQISLRKSDSVFAFIGDASDSQITIDLNSSDNTAKAKQYGDAISGNNIDIYNLKNSSTTIFAKSNNNKAFAVNGSAIAGNKVSVQNSDDNSSVSVFLQAEGNKASSEYGEAIVDNVVDVNGDANVVVQSP